jgi:hypothetical protein
MENGEAADFFNYDVVLVGLALMGLNCCVLVFVVSCRSTAHKISHTHTLEVSFTSNLDKYA